MEKRIIGIIPARGGSKGIPRKNISLLNGKPLIAYTIKNALKSKYIDDVFVSTDDDEIAEISLLYGAQIVKRSETLSGDDVPLDPVILDAVKNIESNLNKKFDLILTLQPTSPLLSTNTIDDAINQIKNSKYDTLISVKNETHLYWMKKNKKCIPIQESRKNRQYLNPIFKETGSIVISRKENIENNERFGDNIFLYEIPQKESIDIDTYDDWWKAEFLLKRRKIVFRVNADENIGLGHVYRAITLAKRLVFNHEIFFVMNINKKMGISKVNEHHFNILKYSNDKSPLDIIDKINPDIIINDILDTKEAYIKYLKEQGYFVVNFEDLGDGASHADLVFNALYENSHPPKNHYYGFKYICLRDEFYIFPKKKVKRNVNHILITFGGSDPNNLTVKTLSSIKHLKDEKITFSIIIGLGYNDKENIKNYVSKLQKNGFSINLKENVSMMAKEMYDADIVITSNGRTIYEVASVGTPCISIAQNEREARHLFVHNSKSVKYIGMATNISENDIEKEIKNLIKNYEYRKSMNQRMLSFDLKRGMDRIIRLIFDYYENMNKK